VNIAIFSEVPLWTSHHAEAVEIGLQNLVKNNFVHFISCKGALEGCPANRKKNPLLCLVCKSQTNYTNIKFLNQKNVVSSTIELDKSIKHKFVFKDIKELQDFSYKKVPIGNMVYSTIVTELNDSFFKLSEHNDRVNKLVLNAIRIYEFTYDYLKNHNIERIYVWNGRRSCDGPSIYAAKNLNIDYFPFISGGGYNKILIRENVDTVHDVPSAIKDLEVIKNDFKNKNKREKLTERAKTYFKVANGEEENKGEKEQINYLGYYQFSRDFKNDLDFFKKYENKRIIAVFTGTYFEFAGVPGYDTAKDFCKSFYDGVEFLQQPSIIPKDSIIVVRWHPNSRSIKGEEKERLNNLINSAPENVIHILPESNFSSYALIDHCQKTIVFGSSISIEACLRRKPVLFVGRNMFQNLDCFEIPSSFEDIKSFILSNSNKLGSYEDALAWGTYFSSFGNYSFEQLNQRSPKEFYYDNAPLRAPLLKFLRYLKNNKYLKRLQ
jgi:hypothetical protein